MSELDDPIFVQYMQSDDIAMAQASAVAYQHELNLNANPTTANEETQKLLNERFTEPHFIVPEFSNENAITIKRPNDEYILAVGLPYGRHSFLHFGIQFLKCNKKFLQLISSLSTLMKMFLKS